MKVEIVQTLDYPPEEIFTVLTDLQHHAEWVAGDTRLVRLTDTPARFGTRWEQLTDLLGRRRVISNRCSRFQPNQVFGWVTGKPIPSRNTISLAPGRAATLLTWSVETEAAGIARLAEPLLLREAGDWVQQSLAGLIAYLAGRA